MLPSIALGLKRPRVCSGCNQMEFIKLNQSSGVLTVSLNRPDKRNAFHPGMIGELTKTFKKLDKTTRAILLTGEGKSFCSGGDLEWMKSMADFTLAQNLKDARELFAMYAAIRNC